MISLEVPSASKRKLDPSANSRKKSVTGGGGLLFAIPTEFRDRKLPRIMSD